MIQRIQTLYLLIIAALMAVTLFSGLAWFAGDAGEFGLYAFGLKTAEGELVQSTVYMGVRWRWPVRAAGDGFPCSVAVCCKYASVWWKWCCC